MRCNQLRSGFELVSLYPFPMLPGVPEQEVQTWINFSVILFTDPSARAGYDTGSIFEVEFNRFEFRVFLLLDSLPHQGWRTKSALLFTHSWKENNWIHTFPKGISAMWNAISLVRDLNSSRRLILVSSSRQVLNSSFSFFLSYILSTGLLLELLSANQNPVTICCWYVSFI